MLSFIKLQYAICNRNIQPSWLYDYTCTLGICMQNILAQKKCEGFPETLRLLVRTTVFVFVCTLKRYVLPAWMDQRLQPKYQHLSVSVNGWPPSALSSVSIWEQTAGLTGERLTSSINDDSAKCLQPQNIIQAAMMAQTTRLCCLANSA